MLTIELVSIFSSLSISTETKARPYNLLCTLTVGLAWPPPAAPSLLPSRQRSGSGARTNKWKAFFRLDFCFYGRQEAAASLFCWLFHSAKTSESTREKKMNDTYDSFKLTTKPRPGPVRFLFLFSFSFLLIRFIFKSTTHSLTHSRTFFYFFFTYPYFSMSSIQDCVPLNSPFYNWLI